MRSVAIISTDVSIKTKKNMNIPTATSRGRKRNGTTKGTNFQSDRRNVFMRWTSAQLNGKLSEHDLQVSCVRWFRQKYHHIAENLFAIPNGADLAGHDRIQRAKRWQKLEREGALPGVADLFLAVPSGTMAGLWIEMKTTKGVQSDKQKRFEFNIVAAGFGYVMPRSQDEFIKVVTDYLEGVY